MNNILILMAGEGTRMTHTNIPKPFIEFNHVPLFHYCSESFNRKDKNNHFIVNKDKIGFGNCSNGKSINNSFVKSEAIKKLKEN